MKLSGRVSAVLVVLAILFSLVPCVTLAAGQTCYGIAFVNADGLNLRQGPGTDTASLASASRNDCVVILENSGEWCHVIYNLQEGYMSASYLEITQMENAELGKGVVNVDAVNLRSSPNTESNILTRISLGGSCDVIGINMGWFKVLYQDYTGYIRSDYLTLTEIPYENQASTVSPQYFRHGSAIGTVPVSSASVSSASSAGSVTGEQIAAKAKEYLGCPYVYGGSSPSGFDCSGFVYYVLTCLGYSPSRTPAAQFSMGVSVSRSDLQPGDIVFFSGDGSSVTHCGIYVGNGQFIHAPNSRSVVSYSDLTSGYWSEHYYGARRVAA